MRRWLLLAAGLPVLAAAVLAGEVAVARRGDNLPDVELDYDATGSRTAVWIGDSTAYGIGVTDGADSVASVVARSQNERVVNLAVSGAILAEVLAEQVPEVAAQHPDVVYVSVGANDVTHLTRSGPFRRDFRALLAALPPAADVVVLGVPDMGAPPRLSQPLRAVAGWRARHLDDLVDEAAAVADRRDRRVTTVDIAGSTGPAFRSEPDRYFAADGYHPSSDGYQLWADAILSAVNLAPVSD